MKKFFAVIMFLLLALPAFATVSTETTKVAYTCNGVITSYAYPFKVLADADLQVIVGTDTVLTLNSDYTVTGAGSSAGTVVLTAGSKCGSGAALTILRNIPATQLTDYVDGEAFSAESIESALDKVTMIQQQQKEAIDRSWKLPRSSSITALMPNPSANNYIGWNAAATGLENKPGQVITTATQYEVDALVSYGGGTSYTQATISAALTAIGTNQATLLLRPGAWAINAPLAFPANVDVKMPKGAYYTFSGTGAVTGLKYATPEMFGGVGDSTDASAAFQKAVDSLTLRGVLLIPPPSVYWSANFTVTKSGVKIIGAGDKPEIRGVTSLPVIKVYGAIASRISDISIENLTIRNGSAVDPPVVYKDGIVVQYVDRFTGRDLYITEIEGQYGMAFTSCTKVRVYDTDVYRYGLFGVSLLTNNEDIWFERVTTDTAVGTLAGNTYGFHQGGGGAWDQDAADRTFQVKRVTYKDCTAKNVPLWAGFDSHGGEDINYDGCRTIDARKAFDLGYVSVSETPSQGLKNIQIVNANAKSTLGASGYSGIVATHFDGLIAKGNVFDGFLNAITINNARNWVVQGNLLKNSIYNGIVIGAGSRNGTLTNNILIDTKADSAATHSRCISILSGAWDTWIDGNIIQRTALNGTVGAVTDPINYYGINMAKTYHYTRIGKNSVSAYSAKYLSDVHDPVLHTSIPSDSSDQVWAKNGDTVTNANDSPAWVCTNAATEVLYYDSNVATDTTVDGTAGATYVTLDAASITALSINNWPDGAGIVIAGAGTGGANLTTSVVWVDTDNNRLYLKNAVITSVTSAATTYISATWTTVP